MKKTLFLLIFMSWIFSLYPEIVNLDKPTKGDWNLNVEKVWEISRYGKKRMALPSLRYVWDDGTICMYDWKRGLHYLLDGDGKLIKSFGKKGEGPGEFRWPRHYYSVNDQLIIYDRPKLVYFSKAGEYLNSIPIGGNFDPPIAFISENEYISRPSSGDTQGKLALVNLKAGDKKTIKNITPFSDSLNLGKGKRVISIGVPWSHPDFHLGFDEINKKLYFGISDSYRITISDIEGNIVDAFSIKRKKRKITKEMEKDYAKRNPGEARMISPQMRKKIPKHLNYFSKIQIINGLVYVFVTNYAEHWDDQQIDIFSLDGIYLYRAVFTPENGVKINSSSIFHGVIIKNGFLYTVLEDDDGETKLVKYKISLPQ